MTATAAQLFAYAASLPCEQLDKRCLERQDLLNLAGCVQGVPPEGVPLDVHRAFCAKMAACGMFDKIGCEPEASAFANEAFGPPTDCLSAEQRELITYCDQHGHMGPDVALNALCWGLQVTPNRTREQLERPSCADADCLTERDFAFVGACVTGQASCPGGDWAAEMQALPLCPDTRESLRQRARQAILADGCLTDDVFDDVVYCMEQGQNGPDAQQNAACFAMMKLGMLAELRGVPRCGPNRTTPAQQVSINRRLEAARQRSAEEATEVTAAPGVPSAEETTPIFAPGPEPTAEETRAVQPTATGPAPAPPTPPEIEEEGISTAWMIGGGLALAAAVGAGVYFMRKKR